MARLGRFGVRRLVVVGSAAALGSGVASVGLLSAAPPAGAAPSCTGTATVTCTFSFTGGVQPFTVLSGITQLQLTALGASGGRSAATPFGGRGGEAVETISVTPGEQLQVRVGGRGTNESDGSSGGVNAGGFNGGGNGFGLNGAGAGGASDVRDGNFSDAQRLIVAGGGGGAGNIEFGDLPDGGDGGGLVGNDGQPPASFESAGGKGGTQVSAGAAGTGSSGHPGNGSVGGSGVAGGGGGFFGGGSGAVDPEGNSGGGGGGSGFTSNGTGMRNGAQAGDGVVTITYQIAFSSPPPSCTAGQTSHQLSATTAAGPISGLFCVDHLGVGTYTQGAASGTALVENAFGGTVIVAHGPDLNLAGLSVGRFSAFTETAPDQAHGTFSLS